MNDLCCVHSCPHEARLALRTTRPRRDTLKTTVWWDDRTAPASASRYCRLHGAKLLDGLVATIVDADRSASLAAAPEGGASS